MTDGPPDAPTAAPLKALGGWADAAWFCTSILTDNEVTGFRFPAVGGIRKQNFQVLERSVAEKPARGRPAKAPAATPKRTAGKLAAILDSFASTRAIACGRSRFLFESAPVLFFAEIPAAKLKPRPAARLRRALIDIGVRGCVVRVEPASVTAMFWPAADDAITGFVQAAVPDHPLHGDFDRGAPAAPGKNRAGEQEKQLLREVAALRQQIETLQRAQSVVGAMETLGLDDSRLKSMLMLLHPDKHGGSEAANEAAKWLNGLREALKGR